MALEERETAYSVEEEPSGPFDERFRDPVLQKLLNEGYLFDFFQAVWLLEQAFPNAPGPAETPDLHQERIRFRPHSGLAFPASDLRSVRWADEDRETILVTLTFMGLYGVASPLPYYFYEAITRETEEVEPFRDFLDIFNHRLYGLFYRVWKKYRPAFHKAQGRSDLHRRIFAGLSGLGTPGVKQPPVIPFQRLMAMAGPLLSRARNVEGLENMASTMLDGLPIRVQENIPRWVPLPVRPLMGGKGNQEAGLGTTAVVGKAVQDISGKFRMVVGPLSLAQYRALLPGGDMARLLAYVVRLYAPDYLDYDVQLQLRASDVPPVRLGGSQRMGQDMWMGEPAGEIVSVLVAYA